jgi:hypothetical protein
MGLLDSISEFASSDQGLGLAQGLLSARGSQGLSAGLAGMQRAKQLEQEMAMKKQFQAMQMEEMQAQAMQRKALAQREQEMLFAAQRKQAALPSLFGQGAGSGPTDQVNAALPSDLRIGAQPALPGAGGLDWKRGLAAGYTPKELQDMAGLRNINQEKVARTIDGKDAQGRPVTYQLDEFGRPVGGSPIEQWKAPIQVSQGDRQTFADPVSLKALGSFKINQSPDSQASSALGWANNSLSRQRMAFDQAQTGKPQFHDGQWVLPPSQQNPQGASIPVPGFSKPLGEGQKKQVTGIDALSSAIDEYKSELGKFSGSALLSPDKRAAMGTKYNNMMLQAKEAYNLGVLNGPDYDILQSVIADPSSIKGAFISNDALKNQASELDRLMRGTRAAVVNGGKPLQSSSAPGASGGWSIKPIP